ncbi:MAG: hypothetical protein QME07_00010 [bacterium]|nr:hypothetical protein [bacterium]
MKRFIGFVGSLGVLVLGIGWMSQAFADLSKNDIEEIRKIVREEVQIQMQSVKEEIRSVKVEIQYVNKRIDDLTNLLYVILAGMFALVGFVLWDRRTALAPAVNKMKALEEREGRLEKALLEFAQKEARLAEAFRHAGIL